MSVRVRRRSAAPSALRDARYLSTTARTVADATSGTSTSVMRIASTCSARSSAADARQQRRQLARRSVALTTKRAGSPLCAKFAAMASASWPTTTITSSTPASQKGPDDAGEERVAAAERQRRLGAAHPRRAAGSEDDRGNHQTM